MYYELEARTRQGMEERIEQLNSMLVAMQSDFSECAKGRSECFFCANDECCIDPDEHKCNFIWQKHNI